MTDTPAEALKAGEGLVREHVLYLRGKARRARNVAASYLNAPDLKPNADKHADSIDAVADAITRLLAALPSPATDAGEVRERPTKLTMPNGDVLECEYISGTDWAKSWSIRYPDTGEIGTTGEQDWELVERYGLTAIADAILALGPQAPSPTFADGIEAAAREVESWHDRGPSGADSAVWNVACNLLAAAIRRLGE